MNIKDVANLKYSNILVDRLIYHRAKIKNIAKRNLRPFKVPLNNKAKNIIEKYGNPEKLKSQYVFPIINDEMDMLTKDIKITNFNRFINQHIKLLAKNNGIEKDISTQWARHSYATHAIRSGQSIESVSEDLHNGNVKTTQLYIAGFEDKAKKEMHDKLMNFLD